MSREVKGDRSGGVVETTAEHAAC